MSDALRDRVWLRTFLDLAARAEATVPSRDIERQEDTVLRALRLLDEQPGVVLADEVGMGKTYEALGVIAARQHEDPSRRVVIVTPGPDLNIKWSKEILAFGDSARPMYRGFRHSAVTRLGELVARFRASAPGGIIVVPVNVFAGSRGVGDQGYLLSCWAQARGFGGPQSGALFRRYREGATERVDPRETKFLDLFGWDVMGPALQAALAEHVAEDEHSLDVLLATEGWGAFADKRRVDDALMALRFRLVRRLIPDIDLLVVDEAHKLKNAESVRATGLRMVFGKKFDNALFLTATPFQLGVGELRQVFSLFSLAKSAPPDLRDQASDLLDHVADYTRTYDDLQRAWRQLDALGAQQFAEWFEQDRRLERRPDDPSLRVVVGHASRLLALKRDRIEPGFRTWMIRSLREDKRVYRRANRTRLRPTGGPGVPFLLYERFIAELFRSKEKTHKAAVQINMVSSYAAAHEGALLAKEGGKRLGDTAEPYRALLRDVLTELGSESGAHPKIDHVSRDAMDAAFHGEKTLIFCARVASVRALRNQIDGLWNDHLVSSWREAFPDAAPEEVFDSGGTEDRTKGRHSKVRDRFQRGTDALYLALRERYIPTLLGASSFVAENVDNIARRANEVLARQRMAPAQAERIDWPVLKRCVEQATAQALHEAGEPGDWDPADLAAILDDRFVPLGLDLVADDVELLSEGDAQARWTITADDVRLVAPDRHLWSHLSSPLVEVPRDLRVRTVERLADYLVSRHVPFLANVLAYARDEGVDIDSIEARALLPVVDRFWTTPRGRPWCDLLRRFLVYAGRLDEERRKEVLDDVVQAGSIVRHTVDGESRERLREAFNTPLHPMILVANEVMQEGLDLHHHCRRVVHHDLAWNPAQLEQRVGRVDRLGSLVQRMRLKDVEQRLEISLPLIANTIDDRLDRVVRMREKWLEILLGAVPDVQEEDFDEEPMEPLPVAFAEALRVELGPREIDAAAASGES